jgi:hypothetical protein
MGPSFSPAFAGLVGVSSVFCWWRFIFSTVTRRVDAAFPGLYVDADHKGNSYGFT